MSRLDVRRRRWSVVLTTVVGILMGFAAGGWAVAELLRPPADVLASPAFTTVTAQRGVVAQSIRLNSAVEWQARAVVNGRASGTVTGVDHEDGALADAGDVLFHVDLRPVVVAQGGTPMFRDLSQGLSGDDVAQLQQFLVAAGFYRGDPSGNFSAGTRWAVREWQRSLGVDQSGVVHAGDVLFVPELPARLALAESVKVGSDLAAGTEVVHVLAEQPHVEIPLAEGQIRVVEVGQKVVLDHGEHQSDARVVEVRPASESEPDRAVLAATDSGPVCADWCSSLPVGEVTLVPSTIEIVPRSEGVVVPAAAIATTAEGSTVVIRDDGTAQPVEVVVGAQGLVVVEGLEPGTSVRIPGDAA